VPTAKQVYSPVWLQVQLYRSDGTIDATPPPDECAYFQASDFNQLNALADFHNAPENDSDAATYFLATGKQKKVAWPRTDGGFEMAKYDARQQITRWEKQLKVLKEKQRALVGQNVRIYDSDCDQYSWMLWLNPKTPDDWVKSRRAARLGMREKAAKEAAGDANAEVVGKDKAIEVWGKNPNPETAKDKEFNKD